MEDNGQSRQEHKNDDEVLVPIVNRRTSLGIKDRVKLYETQIEECYKLFT
jgi:hypothetical protein